LVNSALSFVVDALEAYVWSNLGFFGEECSESECGCGAWDTLLFGFRSFTGCFFKCAGKSKIYGTAFCFNFCVFKIADRGWVEG